MNDRDLALRGHAVRNAELVGKLRSRGVDLQAPRSIEHHFWSRSQRDAALLSHELYRRGFLILVLAPASPREGSEYTWNVEAGKQDTIEHTASDDLAGELFDLAASFNSRYDGWGTSV
ncbi:MAG TPA: ribonuclease E inhibitor RraB [Thermoanaerobaculia bacterium]|nr:ribonuclease E inhibitor RraB [Thermoanaerobaculia bacterium]